MRTQPRAILLIGAAVALCAGASSAGDEIGYARFCTTMSPNFAGGAHYRSAMANEVAETNKLIATATDAEVAQAVQRRLQLAMPPTVVGRNVQQFLHKLTEPETTGPPERALLGDLDPAAAHWWSATLEPNGSVKDVSVVDGDTARRAIGFPRGMAAYALFNDLLGGDEPLPRAGCAALFTTWFGNFHAVNATLQRAIEREPAQDASLSAAVRQAWNVLGDDRLHKARNLELTRESLRAIGKDPAVTVVYRDPGLPGDGIGEIDVVRIGVHPRTYAIVGGERPLQLDGPPLCVVGDLRCGKYYVWP